MSMDISKMSGIGVFGGNYHERGPRATLSSFEENDMVEAREGPESSVVITTEPARRDSSRCAILFFPGM